MSTYPVDIKSTTASGCYTHAGGTAGPGRALGLYMYLKKVDKLQLQLKLLDNATVLAEFLIPAANQTNAQGYTQYMQFPGTGFRVPQI